MKITCPRCGSTQVARRGNYPKQRYQCTSSKHKEGEPRYFYGERSPADILVFDIETLPGIRYFWEQGQKDYNIDSIIQDWCVLSWSAKWLFEPEHTSMVLTPAEAKAHDDKRILKGIWDLLDKAGIVIVHNGQKFDVVKLNWRFIVHDMLPPSPYQVVDTREHATKIKPTSKKLDWLAEKLGYGNKLHTGYGLWVSCSEGDKESLKKMQVYNEKDVYILEDIYVTLRPWLKHPNIALFVPTNGKVNLCPHCGHDHVHIIGDYYTGAGVFDSFRCDNCGTVGRSQKRKRTTNARMVS